MSFRSSSGVSANSYNNTPSVVAGNFKRNPRRGVRNLFVYLSPFRVRRSIYALVRPMHISTPQRERREIISRAPYSRRGARNVYI